jgi:hypothetical protein
MDRADVTFWLSILSQGGGDGECRHTNKDSDLQ